MEAFQVFSPFPLLPFQAYAPRDSDPCRMESGVQDLIMNEIMRRLGVTLTLKCLETSRNAKITRECLSLEALGMSNLGGRKDWRACPEAAYFYLACVFFWLNGGW